MKKRRLFILLLTVVFLPAVIVSVVALFAYVRAPRLVENLDHTGALHLSPNDLTPTRICSVLAAQDRTFYHHHGLAILNGPPLHTTITQTVCKGLFFNGFSPGTFRYRKLLLMALALGFDLRVSKETQLLLFINRVYFGSAGDMEMMGFSAAARTFYKKDVREITDQEFLGLLAMLVGPNRYHVIRNPEANAERVHMLQETVKRNCRPECLTSPPYEPHSSKASS